jgi:Secretion system C-terminal sorting domain
MKTKIKILFILFLFVVNNLFTQTIKFQHVYSGTGYDYGYCVTQTYDNGYAVAGATSSTGNGSTDAYLLKTDSLGIFQWQKTYGGINIDQAYSIQETKDTGFVIAGFTNSFGNGGYDLYVIKTNRYGDTIWTRTYGGSNWDFAYSIAETADNGFIVTGGTYSFGKGYEDIYLLKLNSIGDTLWTKTFGGAKDDEARSIIQTLDGGYILTGYTKSFKDINGSYYTIKTNSLGDTLWTSEFGRSGEDVAYEVIERVYGGYIVGGKSKSSNGDYDGLAANLSITGALDTNFHIYGDASGDDAVHSLKQYPGGLWAVVGYTNANGAGSEDFLLYVETSTGNLGKTIGGIDSDKAYYINKTRDHGFIICGNTESFGNSDHVFLVKTDSNGVTIGAPKVTITDIKHYNKSNDICKLYPNPANEKLYLNFTTKGLTNNHPITLNITDMIGRIYYQRSIYINGSEAIEINTGNLQNGIYIVTIEGDDFLINQKLIIEH